MKNKYELVLLATENDIDRCLENIRYYKEYLHPQCIKIITQKAVIEQYEKKDEIEFVNENDIIEDMSFESVKEYFKRVTDVEVSVGWYLQQFLKILYCKKTKADYYMVWDSDTIPLKEIEMFSDEGKPYFDMKEEYHLPYFITMKNLLGFGKQTDLSFISEHMMISTNLMRTFVEEVEKNSNIEGDSFWKKVINSIEKNFFGQPAFSEFETFGNWVLVRYPDAYILRKYSSCRLGRSLLGCPINQNLYVAAAKDFKAVSFEKWDQGIPFLDYVRKIDPKCRFFRYKFYYKYCYGYWNRIFSKQRKEWDENAE